MLIVGAVLLAWGAFRHRNAARNELAP
jgi:hypothetical protein